MRDEQAHLFAVVRPSVGVVGPLVLPGRSSCARCHDLHRRDRDAAWPTVAAQLRALPGGAPAPAGAGSRAVGADGCDVVLATAVAAQACLQVLAFLDGGTAAPPGRGRHRRGVARGRPGPAPVVVGPPVVRLRVALNTGTGPGRVTVWQTAGVGRTCHAALRPAP